MRAEYFGISEEIFRFEQKNELVKPEKSEQMHSAKALIDYHERAHRSLATLLTHCGELSGEDLNRELTGFGYPTVQLQLHHVISAEKYWVGVLYGRIDVDEDAPDYPTTDSLETYRDHVSRATEVYLDTASKEELNNSRSMMTWGNREQVLTPAHVVMRTLTHIYQHQGQITAMCRILGKPFNGADYPIL